MKLCKRYKTKHKKNRNCAEKLTSDLVIRVENSIQTLSPGGPIGPGSPRAPLKPCMRNRTIC